MKVKNICKFIERNHFEIVHHYRQSINTQRRKKMRKENYRRRKEIKTFDQEVESWGLG
jgi:hypothetical protein